MHLENFTDAECAWTNRDPQRAEIILRMHEWVAAMRAYREQKTLENDFAANEVERAFYGAVAEAGIENTSADAADLHRLLMRCMRADIAIHASLAISPKLDKRIRRKHQKEAGL